MTKLKLFFPLFLIIFSCSSSSKIGKEAISGFSINKCKFSYMGEVFDTGIDGKNCKLGLFYDRKLKQEIVYKLNGHMAFHIYNSIISKNNIQTKYVTVFIFSDGDIHISKVKSRARKYFSSDEKYYSSGIKYYYKNKK